MKNNLPTGRFNLARDLLDRGLSLIELRRGEKTPVGNAWPKRATTDPETVRGWLDRDANIGVLAGQNFVIVDIDTKNGAGGDRSIAELQFLYDDLPQTLTVRTPSGGIHRYYRTRRQVPGIIRWRPGIDILSGNRQAVAPGSMTPAGAYEILDNSPIAEIPDWLADLISEHRPKDTAPVEQAPIAGTWTDTERAAVEHYLRYDAPEAIEGHGGDNQTLAVARRAKDMGVPDEATLRELLDIYNESRCVPQWEGADLDRFARQAFRNARERPGVASPAADFKPLPGDHKSEPESRRRVTVRNIGELTLRRSPPWLVKDTLPAQGWSMMVGKSQAGKSFAALDLAASVALGAPWNGHATVQGAVLYLSLENPQNVEYRLLAIRQRRSLGATPFPLDQVAFDAAGLTLASKSAADAELVIELAREAQKRHGMPIRLIVIDTLARTTAGADENSTAEMGLLVNRLEGIARATGAHVLVIHHTGKDESRGARGSSALFAACDTEIQVSDRTLRITKQRGGEQRPFGQFTLEQVPIGEIDGEAVFQPVVRWLGTAETGPAPLKAGSVAARIMTVLEDLTMGGGGVSVKDWQAAVVDRHYRKNPESGERTWREHRNSFQEQGRISIEGDIVRIKTPDRGERRPL